MHVFGFGTAQIIGKDLNKQVPVSGLTTLAAFVAHIKTFKPADVTLEDYHVIHIFNNLDARYLGNSVPNQPDGTKTSWTVNWAQLDLAIVGALVDEIAAAK